MNIKQKVCIGIVASVMAPLNAPPLNSAPETLDLQDQRVLQALTRALRNRISSPGGALKLNIQATNRSGSGYFSSIAIAGRPVKLRKLQVSEFTMRARDVRIDVPYLMTQGKVRTLQSTTTLRAVVTENDLTAMLARGKRTRDMALKVKYISGARMLVTGNLNYPLINGPVTGIARLRLGANYKVYLDVLSLQLRGREVPQFVKDQFASRINPVIDYQDLPFRPRFRSLSVSGPRAVLSA